MLCLWMVAFHSFFYAGNFVRGECGAPPPWRTRASYSHASSSLTLVSVPLFHRPLPPRSLPDETMNEIGLSPWMLVLNLGFLPVDGFFVLTGFLIAYPLFKEEARRIKLLAEEEKDRAHAASSGQAAASESKAVGASSPWQFDLGTFYYRRVTRMLPSYILAVYFHCGLLFPGGVQHSMDLVRSDSFRNFLGRVLPGETHAPNSCTPAKLFTNFAWMNHLMPFGGCMGWTWSFALQFNFYLFFPLLWKWAHARLARSAPSARRTPSAFVLPFLYVFLVASILVRIFSFLQVRIFDLRHEEGLFLGFFWYSNTLTRGAAVVWGVLAAYASVHTGFISRLRSRVWLVRLGWLASLAVVLCQMFWSRIWAAGNMVETPGWSTMDLTQQLGGEESLHSILSPNLTAYWWHAAFHIGVLVGSPLSNLLFVFLLVAVVNGLGSIGRRVQSILSCSFWYPLSTLSWWVYLVHPALMVRFYAWHVERVGELPASVATVFGNAAFQWLLSFSVATIAYCTIEQPLEILLRQSEAVQQATQPKQVVEGEKKGTTTTAAATAAAPSSSIFFRTLRSLIFVYCVLCMVYIVLHHLAMYAAVLTLEPKPYIEGEVAAAAAAVVESVASSA